MLTKKFVVERFTIGDVEDPYIAAQEFIYKWASSDKGKWCKSNSIASLKLESHKDIMWGLHKHVIVAEMTEKSITEFLLRFK